MTRGSPPWNPQAMFAELTIVSICGSSPIVYAPNPSPISQLRSIIIGGFPVTSPLNRAMPGQSSGPIRAGLQTPRSYSDTMLDQVHRMPQPKLQVVLQVDFFIDNF